MLQNIGEAYAEVADCRQIGTAIGYMGTVFAGLVILVLKVPVVDRFRLTALLFLLFAVPIFVFVREPHRRTGRR